MMLHFLRPMWFWAYVPFLLFVVMLFRQNPTLQALQGVCDAHLLPYVTETRGKRRQSVLVCGVLSAALMIFSLAGPTWSRRPVPMFQPTQPRVVLLDLSLSMLDPDVSPDRLQRAKLILHDVFRGAVTGQWGLVVYTDYPFVASPLTSDAQTIDEWVDTLNPSLMPTQGNRLDRALQEAGTLITKAGFPGGALLVLTATPPDSASIRAARQWARRGLSVSVMPFRETGASSSAFTALAQAGQGVWLPYSANQEVLNRWLTKTQRMSGERAMLTQHIPLWRDAGRWFLIPALLLMLPLFQRGAWQRIRR